MSSADTDSDPCGEGNVAQVPQPADRAEQQRQQALDALEVLDSEPELAFEGLVQAAAAVCGTPIALISLVDRDRQWFKANVGLKGVCETPRAVSFCTHAIEQHDLFVVEDAWLDARFAANPLVRGDPHIRFYAGAPLHLSDGHAVGTLCVIDRQPLRLSPRQREVLSHLGRTAVQLLEGRRALQAEVGLRHQAQGIMREMPIGLFGTDPQGGCTWTNPRWREIFGLGEEECLGLRWLDTLHPQDRDSVIAAGNAMAAEGRDFRQDFRLLRGDASVVHVRTHAKALREGGAALGGYLGFVQDVTTEMALQAELQHQASHDALTQLLNRRAFDACLTACLQEPGQPGHALLYLDVDQFKIINDAAGHAAGDRLLVQLARLLESFQNHPASLARLGGDEFGLLLPHCSMAEAEAMAARIVAKLEHFRFQVGEQRFRVGVSIGVVPLVGPVVELDAVMQAADVSCFTAKESGRNRWHTWAEGNAEMCRRNQAMRWVTRLQEALDQDRLVLHAQRILPLDPAADGSLRAELLLRLREPDGSLVLPAAFLPPAERFQMATRLDQWVLERTLSLLADQTCLRGIDRISLNVSGQSVVDPTFRSTVDQMLDQAGSEVSRLLCFEITETAAITNVVSALDFIATVRRHGCTVALDDFGSGTASFGALKNLPVTHLKIDGHFVTGVIDDPLNELAVRCFVQVAEVIGLRTVAEFVESAEVLERLRQIGVHYAQGYYLHRPEPFETVMAQALAQGAG
jgi:diguanylate cyclase (GGDEF)-like protein/PAS domain S-box-containing protein